MDPDAAARAALDFFVGAWTLRGHEAGYREVCVRQPGDAFVVCHAEDRGDPEPSASMSVFGYDAVEGRYTYAGFDDAGHQRVLRGHRVDGAWRFQGASERGPSWRRWQVTLTPTDDGFRLVEEVSDRAGPWRVAVELEYVRRR